MKKLKLDLDQIRVTSFATRSPDADPRGTVRGHGYTDGPTDSCVFTWPTCNDRQTCDGYLCPNIDILETAPVTCIP